MNNKNVNNNISINNQQQTVEKKKTLVQEKSVKKQSAINIILKAYDNSILDYAVKIVVNLIKQERLAYKGPIPLPSKRVLTTILTSPHIDKHAMNQFEQVTSKRIISVFANQNFIDAILKMDLPSGVDVKIKLEGVK